MIARAPMLTDLFLSLAALVGLVVLHRVIAARGRTDPLNRRFLVGLKVTMLLFAGRALAGLTGVEAFHVLVLIAAALIPLAVLILTEGLLRRHAPPWIKAGIGVGTVVFALVAFVPTALADPLRMYALLSYQMAGLLVAGWMVLRRDKASLSAQENRTVERLGLSLILLIPLAAADFLMNQLGLPIQISALAVLFLCRLAISLGREEVRHGSALVGFVAVVLAAGAASALLAVIFAMDKDAVVVTVAIVAAALLLAVVVNDARALRGEEESLSLLRHLSGGSDDPLMFLRGLQAHPLVEGAALIEAAALADLDQAVLDRVVVAHPVLRRADPLPAVAEEAEHVAHLFDRFAATHILCVSQAPLTLVALAMPAIAASPRAELELRAVQRMARLMAKAAGDGA